jgi:hypothetical protein
MLEVVNLKAGLDNVLEYLVSVYLQTLIRGKLLPRGKIDTQVATPARPPQSRTDRAS